ncbi:MAG: rRNA pseudouridine synthase [Salinivirgaceae bacterium]|nr:MAG: rRNA pseudouridine synthase [Salinivirgaceae bacterium]
MEKRRFDKQKGEENREKRNYSDKEIRLNRYIANSGVCTRREADKLIEKGLIRVNGEVVTELGFKVKYSDTVQYEGRKLKAEKKVFVLLNKPKDTLTDVYDPEGKRTVIDLVKMATKEHVHPVDKLDRNATGVLLFTNDIDLAKRLTESEAGVKQIYHVILDKTLAKTDFEVIMKGLDLKDGFVKPEVMSYVDDEDRTQIGIEIYSCKNKIVQRIFEHQGYKVVKLDRTYFGGLTKKNIGRGKWRILSDKEVNMLKML